MTVARFKLRKRIKVLEDCEQHLFVLICCEKAELVAVMEGKTSPQDLRSLLQQQFDDAEYLIGLMQKARDYLTGRVNHRELQQCCREECQRLYSKYACLKNDIIVFLDYLEHGFNLY
ncbi:hypothetical protein TNCV_1449381 [Trichonephila clavipes]|nr:hypothetical protein TNCV_1449381 [Trichonephila clavipes]